MPDMTDIGHRRALIRTFTFLTIAAERRIVEAEVNQINGVDEQEVGEPIEQTPPQQGAQNGAETPPNNQDGNVPQNVANDSFSLPDDLQVNRGRQLVRRATTIGDTGVLRPELFVPLPPSNSSPPAAPSNPPVPTGSPNINTENRNAVGERALSVPRTLHGDYGSSDDEIFL